MGRLIDETGNRYGKLVVVERDGVDNQGCVKWHCQCDCGNAVVARGVNLRKGTRVSCGCVRLIDERGNKYGRLTVLRRVNISSQKATWLCRCECGNEVAVRGGSLRNGSTKSCGCWSKDFPSRRLRSGLAAMRLVKREYRQKAKERGYSWMLTEEEFYEISQQLCHYCGIPPSNIRSTMRCYGDFMYNGLDRVDNTKGYVKGNVVPCCHICNHAKSVMTYDEFLAWVERVYTHTKGGKSDPEK